MLMVVPKQKVKPSSKKRVFPAMHWLGLLSVVSFALAYMIGWNYHTIVWQMVDTLGQNLVLSFRSDILTQMMTAITNFGYYGTALVWLVIIGVLAVKRHYAMLMVSVFLSLGGFGVGMGIKVLVARIRPTDFALLNETSHSFPSLHAFTAIVLYLFIAYLVYYYWRRFLGSYLVFLVGFGLALLIGFSRVYLGVHYLTDIIAGFIFGVSWFLLILYLEKCFYMFLKNADGSQKI